VKVLLPSGGSGKHNKVEKIWPENPGRRYGAGPNVLLSSCDQKKGEKKSKKKGGTGAGYRNTQWLAQAGQATGGNGSGLLP